VTEVAIWFGPEVSVPLADLTEVAIWFGPEVSVPLAEVSIWIGAEALAAGLNERRK
jgi:hypothetical protein